MSKKGEKTEFRILSIDPGEKGGFVLFINGVFKASCLTPLKTNSKKLDFKEIVHILKRTAPDLIICEKPTQFNQGARHAFTYGMGYQTILLAIESLSLDRYLIMIEPPKWAAVIHRGLNSDLKPKVKTEMAVRRMFANCIDLFPRLKTKKDKLHDGVMDAAAIGAYGCKLVEAHKKYYSDLDLFKDQDVIKNFLSQLAKGL